MLTQENRLVQTVLITLDYNTRIFGSTGREESTHNNVLSFYTILCLLSCILVFLFPSLGEALFLQKTAFYFIKM